MKEKVHQTSSSLQLAKIRSASSHLAFGAFGGSSPRAAGNSSALIQPIPQLRRSTTSPRYTNPMLVERSFSDAADESFAAKLYLSSEDAVILEGPVDKEEAQPWRTHQMGHDWTAGSRWKARHLTLLSDGSLCCSARSRAQLLEERQMSSSTSKKNGPLSMIKLTYQALCVRCSAGVAYGRRPYAFVIKTRSCDHYFAVGSVEELEAWVQSIRNAIAAFDGTARAQLHATTCTANANTPQPLLSYHSFSNPSIAPAGSSLPKRLHPRSHREPNAWASGETCSESSWSVSTAPAHAPAAATATAAASFVTPKAKSVLLQPKVTTARGAEQHICSPARAESKPNIVVVDLADCKGSDEGDLTLDLGGASTSGSTNGMGVVRDEMVDGVSALIVSVSLA